MFISKRFKQSKINYKHMWDNVFKVCFRPQIHVRASAIFQSFEMFWGNLVARLKMTVFVNVFDLEGQVFVSFQLFSDKQSLHSFIYSL